MRDELSNALIVRIKNINKKLSNIYIFYEIIEVIIDVKRQLSNVCIRADINEIIVIYYWFNLKIKINIYHKYEYIYLYICHFLVLSSIDFEVNFKNILKRKYMIFYIFS